jgi:hypothetical protein
VRMKRAEAFNGLLERFGSAKEFTDFLQTDEGKKFLRDPMPAPKSMVTKIIRFVQAGIIVFGIGVTCLLNGYRLRDATDLHYAYQAKDSVFWGILGVTVGISLIVTALVSYIMARKWNLMNGNGNNKQLPG